MEYIAERPHTWLDRQLVMEEVEAEVVSYHRERQREQMSRQR